MFEQKLSPLICESHQKKVKYINLTQSGNDKPVKCSFCGPIQTNYIDFEMVEEMLILMKQMQESQVSEILLLKQNQFNVLLQQIYKFLQKLTNQAELYLKQIRETSYQENFFERFLDSDTLTYEDLEELSFVMKQNILVERDRYKIKEKKIDQSLIDKFDEGLNLLNAIVDQLRTSHLIDELQQQPSFIYQWGQQSSVFDTSPIQEINLKHNLLMTVNQNSASEWIYDNEWRKIRTLQIQNVYLIKQLNKSQSFISIGDEIYQWNNYHGQWNNFLINKQQQNNKITIFDINSDDTCLVMGKESGEIEIYQKDQNKWKICQGLNQNSKVTAMAFNKMGTLMSTGSQDCKIYIWKLIERNWIQLQVIAEHQGSILQLIYFSHSNQFISSSTDKTIRIWDYDLYKYQQSNIIEEENDIQYLQINEKASQIMIGTQGKIGFWKKNLQNKWINYYDTQCKGTIKQLQYIDYSKSLYVVNEGEVEIFQEQN